MAHEVEPAAPKTAFVELAQAALGDAVIDVACSALKSSSGASGGV
jgi:hypothetical protein